MPRFALRRFVRHGMLPQLMVFDAVARLGSVTRAAAELHIAQPTVSTQLKKLADTLELRLFEQRGRQLHLTPAGRALVEICEDLTELLLRAETRLRALRRPEPETVRLAAASGARQLAARLLAGFCARHPGVQAGLHLANRAELLERMWAGDDDLYLITAAGADDGTRARHIATDALHLYAPAGHPLARQRRLALEQLADEPMLAREPGSGLRATLVGLFERKGLRPSLRAELPNEEAIAEGVAAGAGLALLSDDAARASLRAGRIARLEVEGLPLERRWCLVYAASRRLSSAAQLFLREALDEAGHGAPTGLIHMS